MTKRSGVVVLVFGLLLCVLLAGGGTTPAHAAPERAAAGYRCIIDAFGHTAGGRITLRRVVNTRVTVSKRTAQSFRWRPIAWGLVSAETWPGHETTRQLVAATDGRIRLVETRWDTGSALRVRVLRVVGSGYPARLVAFDDHSLYWVAADRSLHRATWTGSRLVRPTRLPVTLGGATALGARTTDYGMRVYWTDMTGALHLVADAGAASTDRVLKSSGFRGFTGLRTGVCMSPDQARVRPYDGLLSVDRTRGIARFQRVLRPASPAVSSVTAPARVGRADWTWPHLG
ncbi:hypothetical protein [Nocardioides sp. LML1-1-1.1]|uniref:hypothetical protein n=1 Tax=Nocardioides sp. LML1-1-1.1 TaxID=3135248 RepID=UPI003414094D